MTAGSSWSATGSTATLGDLAPLWPADVAAAAIARAHELGARVTAHVFGEQAVAELVDAGIDGIEHGTGISAEMIALMAERQVALVPTMLQLDNFEQYAAAGEARFPTLRGPHPRPVRPPAGHVFGAAHDAGVPIYAGTDAGGYLPHGLVGAGDRGARPVLGAEDALAAGSWAARGWLGHAGRPGRRRAGRPRRASTPTRGPISRRFGHRAASSCGRAWSSKRPEALCPPWWDGCAMKSASLPAACAGCC